MTGIRLADRMARLGTESAFEVLARAKALQAQGKSIINLGIGSPDFRTPENIVEAGRKALADGPVTFYCGFDPTAPSLHVGHLVQVLTRRTLTTALERAHGRSAARNGAR